MKNLFRTARALSPWLSLAAPLLLFFILQGLKYLSPNLFCVAVNPGGKEFICGPGYSHVGIGFLRLLGLCVWVLLLLIGFTELYRGSATRPAVIAWSVSAVLFVSLTMLALSLPATECP